MAESNLPLTFGQRLADKVASTMGSWKFIIIQSIIIVTWLLINLFTPFKFDAYPFILLNLFLSFQAAYTAPAIMMSSNRKEDIDRKRSIAIYNLESDDHKRLEFIVNHLDNHFNLLNKRIDALESSEFGKSTSPKPTI